MTNKSYTNGSLKALSSPHYKIMSGFSGPPTPTSPNSPLSFLSYHYIHTLSHSHGFFRLPHSSVRPTYPLSCSRSCINSNTPNAMAHRHGLLRTTVPPPSVLSPPTVPTVCSVASSLTWEHPASHPYHKPSEAWNIFIGLLLFWYLQQTLGQFWMPNKYWINKQISKVN